MMKQRISLQVGDWQRPRHFYFSYLALLCGHLISCSNVGDSTTGVHSTVIDSAALYKNTDTSSRFLYEPNMSTLRGRLGKKDISIIENEGDTTGPKDSILILALMQPVSVVNPPGTDTVNDEEYPPNEYNVDTIQLAVPSYHTLDKYMGHIVQLTGTLYHSDNGRHFTDVLLFVRGIKYGKDSATINSR